MVIGRRPMLSYSTVCPTRHWISFNFLSPVPGIKSNFFWGYGLGNLIYRILVSGDFSGDGGGRGGGGGIIWDGFV